MKRRWHRKREQATHADDWLMTYADMITLLLCLFAVLLSLSIPRKMSLPKIEEVTQRKAATPMPAPQPEKLSDMLKDDPAFHGLPPADPMEESTPPPPVKSVPAPALEIAPPVEARNLVPPEPVQDASQFVGPMEPAIRQAPVETASYPPPPVPEIEKAGDENKGDRITMLQMSSAAFFSSGSAALSDSGKAILQDVAVNLKAEQYKDYQITVEGHTDDAPISTSQFPSNWELSTARASAVVHFFLEQGIAAQKLRAAGYADTFPVAPNRDANNNPLPENQAQNRRVVIKLEKIEKTDR